MGQNSPNYILIRIVPQVSNSITSSLVKLVPIAIDWAQLSRFYLNKETESSLQIAVFWQINRTALDKDSTMDNVKKYNIWASS
jgi:hypothetical protein